MLQPQLPAEAPGLLLVRLGGALLALGGAVSWLAAPDRSATLLWYVQLLVGVGVVIGLSAIPRSGRRGVLPGRIQAWKEPSIVSGAVLALGYVLAIALPLLTDWRADKAPWLSPFYSAIPSLVPHAPAWIGAGVNPNQTGGILATFAAFSIGFLLHHLEDGPAPPSRLRIGAAAPAAVLVAIATAGVVFSGSRAAGAALLVAAFFAMVLRNRYLLWAVLGFLGAGLAVAAVRPSAFDAAVGFLLREETVETKLLARADIWLSAVQGIADHAFTGIGLATLNDVLPVRYPYETVGLSYTVSQAHNILLDTALTLGVPAALGFALLSAGLLVGVTSDLGRERRRYRGIAVGAGAAFVGCLIFGLTDALSLSTPSSLLLWVWAGLMMVSRE
ncbi:MAG: O-antigen ligase family protein [Actinobacteria bacterium]|nr:O-antigen ligase family protein [Actinomycetota bacterium]